MTKYPNKDWTRSELLLNLRKCGTINGSDRQCTVHTDEVVMELPVLCRDSMNGHVKLNMGIIFGSFLMLFCKIEYIFSTFLGDANHQSWHVF